MNNFLIAFNAVAPLASYILIGIFIKRLNLVEDDFLGKLNRLLFKCFYPVIVFSNIYTSDFSQSADVKLIAYLTVFSVTLTATLCFVVPKFIRSRATCGAFIQGTFRSNIILFGLPLTISIFGDGNAGMMSVATAFIIPLYNVLAVVVLEYFGGQTTNISALLKNIAKNPLIIGAIIGILYNLFKLPAPALMQSIVKNISNSTTTFALIVLGASLRFSSLARNLKYIAVCLFLRLIAVPAAAVLIAYFIGLEDMQLFTVLIIAATPVATSSYTMAHSMNSDHELAAQLVAISTVLSVFTIFSWIMLFFTLGLI
ncbi:MAG: AEC family transporter [Firmicutes bacterium]|nr:AEC family transporter [Bacillota bacterium]